MHFGQYFTHNKLQLTGKKNKSDKTKTTTERKACNRNQIII